MRIRRDPEIQAIVEPIGIEILKISCKAAHDDKGSFRIALEIMDLAWKIAEAAYEAGRCSCYHEMPNPTEVD